MLLPLPELRWTPPLQSHCIYQARKWLGLRSVFFFFLGIRFRLDLIWVFDIWEFCGFAGIDDKICGFCFVFALSCWLGFFLLFGFKVDGILWVCWNWCSSLVEFCEFAGIDDRMYEFCIWYCFESFDWVLLVGAVNWGRLVEGKERYMNWESD